MILFHFNFKHKWREIYYFTPSNPHQVTRGHKSQKAKSMFGCCIVIQFSVLKYKNVWVPLLDILFGISFSANETQNLLRIFTVESTF